MKFKDYLNSLVSRRKSSTSSKSHHPIIHKKNTQESTTSADCHYDICGYEDINGIVSNDQHTRTQILLARHAELVNTIVETRISQENTFPSCSQCRVSRQSSPMIPPPPLPPPLPPKLSLEQQITLSNRQYSSTLATCSPHRECQHLQKQPQQQQLLYYQSPLTSSQYPGTNTNINSSSSSSLWTTTTESLSKKQRSRIRTNPWINKSSTNNRQSTFIESSHLFNHQPSPDLSLSHPEYGIYDSTYRTSPSGITHSESFPQTTSNGNVHINNPSTSSSSSPPPPLPPSAPAPTTSSVILHQSDSGHGFSLSSSRVINSSLSSTSTSSSSSSSPSSPPPSSSSPDDTSADGILSNNKQSYRQKKLKKKTLSTSPLSRKKSPARNINIEQNFCSNTISSDGGSLTRRTKSKSKEEEEFISKEYYISIILAHQIPSTNSAQYRYQRSLGIRKPSPIKTSIDRKHSKQQHSHSSSSQSIDDHFSLEFEEILENERSCKQRKDKQFSTKSISPTKSPFILPLDEINKKNTSPPSPIVFTSTLTKTNSRAILKHIEEIENEIRLIKNLDIANNGEDEEVQEREEEEEDDDEDEEYIISPHAYPEEDIDLEDENNNDIEEVVIQDGRQSIYDQVDQWVEKCLTTTATTTNNNNSPSTRLHTECDHLSKTIKDYVVCVCPNDNQQTIPIPEQTTQLMTAFYLSSIPTRTTKRTSSFIAEPVKLEESQTVTQHLKSIHECPF
ncbi:unnamed protein product [Adineta steineri]|uniref:Uncharacterized protein n=1 Tax=Adineta steineri TaxID=433720 RepID=A0A813TEA6_9BILA|nr:unnamed protein product [Adineta steineri]CAF0811398.1 unnamed protein product [Adineta steineri]